MVDCGITKACTRLCPQKDFCSADNANYVVTFGMKDRSNQDEPEIEFKLGGNLARNKSVKNKFFISIHSLEIMGSWST